jgi:hypothetical protein
VTEVDTDTELYTRHGLHMNQKGKEQTALKITNEVKDTTQSSSVISSGAPFVYYCHYYYYYYYYYNNRHLPLNIQDAKLILITDDINILITDKILILYRKR